MYTLVRYTRKNQKWLQRILGDFAILVLTAVSTYFIFRHNAPNVAIQETDTDDVVVAPDKADTTSPYLDDEEVVIIEHGSTTESDTILPITKVLFEYIEVIDGCGPHFEGECLRVRGGPGIDYPVVAKLRNGMILKVDGKVERDGTEWYKIIFDETLRYPERVTNDWYVAAPYVEILLDEGDKTVWDAGSTSTPTTTATTSAKKILVDRTDQKLYAYEGDTLFMEATTSTGLELTPTPRGTFTIFKKTPSRYMQGPLPGLPGNQYYDLPGVPWNLYFTHEGAVIHGAYWHTSFGSRYSHGCVNLPPEEARRLYNWAELGTKVIVSD